MNNEFIKKECENTFEEIVEIRRELHRFPEMGNSEFRTTEIIMNCLDKWGVKYERLLETGVVATVEGAKGGKTVALRADIDALPIEEKTELSFSSQNEGRMHACGHDIHTAVLLGTAKILSKNKDKLCGKVKLIFEPDEELLGGAERLIEKGAMKDVSAVFGLHVRPELPKGHIQVKYGKSYAAADVFEIDVIGKSVHGAEPQKGIDALLIASHIVTALQTVVSRNLAPTESAVLSVCTFNAGTVCNQIAGKATFGGIMRSLGKETREKLKSLLTSTAIGIAESMGAKCEVRIRESYPGITNDNEMTAFLKECAEDILGKENVSVSDTPLMTSEDFGFYLDEAPGSFYHVGCECDYPLHSDRFNPDESAILTGMLVDLKAVNEFLNK
ncbi:MAG: amidohydrolase [Clostridia bacterium]|nr:amidohydrolase [Clostridia bacterium]